MTVTARRGRGSSSSSTLRALLEEAAPSDGEALPSGRLSSGTVALEEAIRAGLELALLSGEVVSVVLRGDPSRGMPVRVVDGVVSSIQAGGDGRLRVMLTITEDTSQLLLLERILRVQPHH